MNCLILGGAGFLGTHLTNELLKKRQNFVTVFGRAESNYSNIHVSYNNIRIVTGNFTSSFDFLQLTKGQDVVFHLISTTVPSTSNVALIDEIEENIIPSIQLLKACVTNHVKKIVFMSSGGTVYGIKKESPLLEDDETTPICSYGIQKLVIEKYIQLFYHIYGLDYRIIRLANPYGSFQNPKGKVGAVTTFLWRIMHNQEIEIYGDGSIVRDYIYVEDAIKGVLKIVDQESEYKIFNLGSGKGYNLCEILATAEQVANKKAMIKYLPARSVDVPYNVLDISRYIEVTKDVPQTSLVEGMEKLKKYFLRYDKND